MTQALLERIGRREESLAVQSIILTGARVAGFVFTFAIPLVLVRVFDQATFGDYKQLFLIAGTAIPILSVGLWASIFYFVPRDEGEGQRYVFQAIGLLTLTGGIAGAGLALGAEQISDFFAAPHLADYLPLLGLYVLLATPAGLVMSVPVADRRPVAAGLTIVGIDMLRATFIIGVALLVGTLRSVVWAAIAIAIVQGTWLLLYLQFRRSGAPRRANVGDMRSQLRYSLPFALAVLFEIGLARFHEYFVAAHASSAEFAIYAVGILQIPLVAWLVQSVVEVMLVRSASAHEAGDRKELRRVWLMAVERLAVVLFPCWAAAELLGTDLIGILFGTSYLPAVPIFRAFLFLILLMIVVDHGVLRATGDTRYLLKASAAGFAVSVAAVFAFGSQTLFLGAVVGYLAGVFTARGLGLLKVGERLELHWLELLPWRLFGRLAIAVGLSAIVASPALTLAHPALRLLSGSFLFALIYVAIALRWQLVPRDELTALLARFIPAYR